MRSALTLVMALSAVILLSMTGCKKGDNAAGAGGTDGSAIKIGLFVSTTGPVAQFGKATKEGAELAVEEINAAGGINGATIDLIFYDIRSDSGEATTAAKKLATEDKVNVAIGAVASSFSKAAAPTFQQNGVPMITPSSTNPTVTTTGDHIFRVCFIDNFQGAACAEFASTNMKAKTAAVVLEKGSAYSQGLAQFFKSRFEKAGGKVVVEVEYPSGEKDFSTVVSNIAKAEQKVETVFLPIYYEDAAQIARELRKQGVTVPLLGGDGWESPTLVPLAGDALEGCFFGNHYNPKDDKPKTRGFVEAYKKKFGVEPSSLAALGYDAVYAVKAAAENGGGNSRDQITSGLTALKDFEGATGTYSIDEKRNARKAITMLKIVGDKFEQVRLIQPNEVD